MHTAIKIIFSLTIFLIIISTAKELVTDEPERIASPQALRLARLIRIFVDIAIIIWFWLP